MIEKEEDFTRVYIGKDNFQMLVLGGSGTAGKTMTMETIAEEINLCNNHIVIFLTDTKKIFENAHCMFPPQDYKHRQILERVGKAESRKKVKLYHPFTFNLPKHSLPDMNLFTFNINDLSRDEFSMLAESYADSDAIKLLLESQKALKKDENWIDLLHIAQDRVKSKKKKFFGKDISDADKSSYYLERGSSGTGKSVSEISSYFKPFEIDYCIGQEECKLNIDIKEILSDNKHYHVLLTKWINDEKMMYFVIYTLFNLIEKNLDYAKYPVLFIIEEVRDLTPRIQMGYQKFMSSIIAKKLSKIRSEGEGCSSILTTQVLDDTSPIVTNSATITLIGNLGATRDIEKVSKIYKYSKETVKKLSMLDKGQYIIRGRIKEDEGDSEPDIYSFFPPSHGHKEEGGNNFITLYRMYYGDKMRDYRKEIGYMKTLFKENVKKAKERFNEKMDKQKKNIEAEAKRKERVKRLETELEELKSKGRDAKQTGLDERNKEIVDMYDEEGLSFQKIGDRYGISKVAVMNAYNDYKKKEKLPKIKDDGINQYD